MAGKRRKCRLASHIIIHSYEPHLGEEAPLVGSYGSGTIFVSLTAICIVFSTKRVFSDD
ncbi:hypothetical protein ACFLUJ_01755 [Chloroflexota bacterium]